MRLRNISIAYILSFASCVSLIPKVNTLLLEDATGALIVETTEDNKYYFRYKVKNNQRNFENIPEPKIKNGHIEVFHIVTAKRLYEQKVNSVTYLGTLNNYHLMRKWIKVFNNRDQIQKFALQAVGCKVENIRRPYEEFQVNDANYRHVEITETGCSVAERGKVKAESKKVLF